ncbi:MAG TPA: peptidoglycan bridge formation glycyltransferase FemA/FemB family protein [Candidatus Magasanikbacteria bacterium]|nr:peptidoglycan bridge formation glycyltransferase FemA/FemB family protein [Candidatus Magasanikbacteria bacterium]
MVMIIKRIHDEKTWSHGLASMGDGMGFMYGWNWGEFQSKTGAKVVRLGFFDGDMCQAVLYGVEQKVLFLGNFIYFPRCSAKLLSADLFEFLRREGYFFVRFESEITVETASVEGAVSIPNRQPKQTLVLALDQGEDDLLAGMHEKTRYNIRLAARKGVVVREEKNAEIFCHLNEMTTKRDGFRSHGRGYYREMLAVPEVKMFVAEYGGRPLAAIIGIFSEDTFTYLHGASSDLERNLMAPYLVQWSAMKALRDLGVRKYDFWGVSPRVGEGDPQGVCFHGFCYSSHHKWAGVTRFKAGFGGEYIEYPEAREVILDRKKYKLFALLKKFL